LLVFKNFLEVFPVNRLEIQFVGQVIVGGNRFRIAIDHDSLIAYLLDGQYSVYAAVIKLDALTDTVGP
jgi:hypothetical protein